MDLTEAVRLVSLREVAASRKDPPEATEEYLMRTIRRWYSREFSTPLAEVEDVHDEDLLQHYFEAHFEGMAAEDFDKVVADAVLTPEQRRGHELGVAAEDLDLFRLAEEARAENVATAARKKVAVKKPEPAMPEIDLKFGKDFDVDPLG